MGPGITADFFCHSQMIWLSEIYIFPFFKTFCLWFPASICALEPLNARNHRKYLAFPMKTSAHSCLLLLTEVWQVIMQLYKLISLPAAGWSARKAESHLSFLLSGWCDTRCHLCFVKTPRCGGCSQHGQVRVGLVFGLWSSRGTSRLKDPLVPGKPAFPCRPKTSWSSSSCLVAIINPRCGLLAPSLLGLLLSVGLGWTLLTPGIAQTRERR